METMERGEKGGMVLDSGEDSSGSIEEAINVENKANTQADKVVDESGGATDINGGTEIPQDGAVDGQEETEVDPNGEIPGKEDPNQLESFKAEMKAEIAKLTEKPEEPPKPMSDEQWAKLEQDAGAPRQTIEFFTNQNVKVVNKLMDYIDSKFSKIEVGESIQSVAREPGFSDASRYKKEINEFLGDYDAKHWSNPNLIKKAVIYARGLNAGANLSKVRTDMERNKKIGGPARPSSPNAGVKRPANQALTGAHKEVAALMGSESEYQKFRGRQTRTLE